MPTSYYKTGDKDLFIFILPRVPSVDKYSSVYRKTDQWRKKAY